MAPRPRPSRAAPAGPIAPVPDAPGSDDGDRTDIDAGPVSAWLVAVAGAIAGDGPSAVPCGSCTACCTSSQFVHIAPSETDALAHIPAGLTFPAPGLPRGHVLLGYDERGHCPMLVDGACSIYEHRPRTCRAYDCRVFPATGLAPDDGQALIARQASRWRFEVATDADRARLAAVRAATAFLRRHADDPDGTPVPTSPTQLAVLAIEIHHVFLHAVGTPPPGPGTIGGTGGDATRVEVIEPPADAVHAAIAAATGGERPRR